MLTTNDSLFSEILNSENHHDLMNILYAVEKSTILAVTDAKGTIIYVNDNFCKISKYSREELIGNDHRLVNSRQHPKSFFIEMWRTISRGEIWNGLICNMAKDGSIYWVETTIFPFLGEDKRPYKYVAIRKDVTTRVELEKSIEKERIKTLYSEKMASLGEMAAGIAHEVGNPLGAILGRMEMLENQAKKGEVPAEKILQTTQKVIGLVERTSKIIRGLRSYARDASADPFAKVDVAQLVGDILEFSAERFRRGGVSVSAQGFERTIFVECREAEIGQVLVNLIANSCDALRECEERWVKISLVDAGSVIRILVEDNGPGIASEIRPKIFEPFYSTKETGKGTGLGLSISSSIARRHSGSLELDNSRENTCFVLTLPKRVAEDANVAN